MFSAKDLESYVADARSALELKFVKTEADFFDEGLGFHPQFTHQVFGDQEKIFGYKQLKIKLYYTPDDLRTYVGLSHGGVASQSTQGVNPDNVVKTLAQYIPEGFTTSQDEFLRHLSPSLPSSLPSSSSPPPFTPMGELLHSYQRKDKTYQVYKADVFTPRFLDYHSRLQTFLLWFVDAASFIDIDDEKWHFYLLFEKVTEAGSVSYSIVGFASVYGFYAFPDKVRWRISQMLILPPFQRKGHGAQLLRCVYDSLVPLPSTMDITVEDPSPEFQTLRDFVDCQNTLALGLGVGVVGCGLGGEEGEGEGEGGRCDVLRTKLKLSKKQCQRVREILRLRATDRSSPGQYRDYRLAVKNRLNGPYLRAQQDLEKLRRSMSPAELALLQPPESHDSHVTKLANEYQALEEEYLSVIEKLAASPRIG